MERLTKRTKNGASFNLGNIQSVEEMNDRVIEQIQKICDKLCDIEDKLESGQLVELPCKIHDTLYTHKKVFGKYQIEELECWGFHCDGRKILFIDCQNARTTSSNSLRAFRVEDFGKTVFTDKAQAEARLKELQEKN